MRLSTATKIRLAGALYRTVAGTRGLFGLRSDPVRCRRGGVNWSLDLSDGIQLSIYLFGAFERATARALRRLLPTGGVAVDVGANIGAHTLPMARHVGSEGRVIAFEPTGAALARLRTNLSLNPGLDDVVTVCACAIVAPGDAIAEEYYSSWPVSVSRSERHAIHRGVSHSTAGSEALTLDDAVARQNLSRLDVVKIDVDGNEVRVLRGATVTLSTRRPSLVLEVSPYALEEHGDSLNALLALLNDAGYRLLDERSFSRVTATAEALARVIPTGGSINVVALPAESPVVPAHA